MTELKFYLLCFMIAAPYGALGSAAAERGWSYLPKSRFVEKWADGYNYFSSVKSIESFSYNRGVCFALELKDSHALRFDPDHSNHCFLDYYFSDSVCLKDEGEIQVYVRKDFLPNASPYGNATGKMDSLDGVVPGRVVRYYRVESPTILEFGDLTDFKTAQSWKEVLQYFATQLDRNSFVYSESPAFVDPSCYTTNMCSYMLMTSAPEIPESDILVLYDICGQSIQVDSGKSFYVLSHEGIGCKNFPNDYPVADCSAEFTGAGEITLNVTLVNFRESDQCDGFTMTAVTDDASGSSVSTDLCDATAPTELTSAGGKVKIEFVGSASPTREKYGFDIQVTAA